MLYADPLRRWAERGAVGYEALAEDGALVLGERLRDAGERAKVVGVLHKVMRTNVRDKCILHACMDRFA